LPFATVTYPARGALTEVLQVQVSFLKPDLTFMSFQFCLGCRFLEVLRGTSVSACTFRRTLLHLLESSSHAVLFAYELRLVVGLTLTQALNWHLTVCLVSTAKFKSSWDSIRSLEVTSGRPVCSSHRDGGLFHSGAVVNKFLNFVHDLSR
jgi:hypothetical protein